MVPSKPLAILALAYPQPAEKETAPGGHHFR